MTNIAQLLTGHIDIWTAADTEKKTGRGRTSDNAGSVYGVKKLRELILELAVRGKLVPQDPNDEPASELLIRIQAEKAKLIAEGKLKKEKSLAPIGEDEKSFELPSGWEWVRVGSLGYWGAGATPLRSVSSYYGGSMPWFKSGELIADFIDMAEETVTDLALKECSLRLNQPGDVLLAMYGATIGKASILKIAGTTNQAVCACTPNGSIFNRYLLLMLKAMKSNFVGQGAGGAQPNISREKIIATLTALPPLAEQHRIVAKVDELMALCDQLEQQHSNAQVAHENLVSQLLATLTQSQNAVEFNASWQRIYAHFEELFTTEASIDTLKKTLLQLAVMGKLVPQNPSDEPASELLKRIQAEKARLIAKGELKKEKMLDVISEDEKPFALPDKWEWIRIGEICRPVSSGSTPSAEAFRSDKGIPFLKVYNIRNQQIDFQYKPQFIEKNLHQTKLKRSIIYPNDIVMNIVGPPLGKVAIIPDTFPEWNCNQAIVFFGLIKPINEKYVLNYLKESSYLNYIELIGTAGQDNISVTKSKNILLPIPPLSEQHRIVAKVDELMALCDQLKTLITEANRLQQKLADVMVEYGTAQQENVK